MDHFQPFNPNAPFPRHNSSSAAEDDVSLSFMPPVPNFPVPGSMEDYLHPDGFEHGVTAQDPPERSSRGSMMNGFNAGSEYDDARSVFGNQSAQFNAFGHASHMTPTRSVMYGYGPQYASQQPAATMQQQQQQQQQQQAPQHHHHGQQYTHRPSFGHQQSYPASFGPHGQPGSVGFGPHTHAPMTSSVAMPTTVGDLGMIQYTAPVDQYGPLNAYQNDLQNGLLDLSMQNHSRRFQHPAFGPSNMLSTSPTDGASSASSDGGWQFVDYPDGSLPRGSMDSFDQNHASSTVSNPSHSLHLRSDSDSSQAKASGSANSVHSMSSFEDVPFPMQSPQSEPSDISMSQSISYGPVPPPHHIQDPQTGSILVYPSTSPSSSSPSPVSPGSTSPLARRKNLNKVSKQNAQKKTATTKAGKKASPSDKKGRRQGPLTANKRQHASLVRKVGACLRCKFLKKTCGEGDPCHGCQPSHARLWQVPCTRLDIKDLGFFVSKWDVDYRRHVSMEISDANIKGYSPVESVMWITHGYGIVFPVRVRQVFVRDNRCFDVDWVETSHDMPMEFDVHTAHMTVGSDGLDSKTMQNYLDEYVNDRQFFIRFIDNHFGGTKFLTEMLKTAWSYYERTQDPMIRKALKLILAYNLTQHITMVSGPTPDNNAVGKIEEETSKFYGKVIAPSMINFQVKYVLAMTWRSLQDDVLKELSALYTSVYSGEKLKNWPTIFMLASILLAVWEEMQFDAHYRMGEGEAARKFCKEMETTPVGVIIGLFSAISQKLPAFKDWDTRKHSHVLNDNTNVCDAMTEMRGHVVTHEEYLKTRPASARYDRDDFDSLSSKFLSRLVIRAN